MIWHPFMILGTAAGVLALHLMLLRVSFDGRRPFLALTRRWVAAPAPASTLVLALLAGLAASAFATAPALVDRGPIAPLEASAGGGRFDGDADLEALSAYAGGIAEDAQPPHAQATSSPMPGVDEMIDKLVQRLKDNPGDVRGWKMLGWSYLNTGQAGEAVRAYEAALRLLPGDTEIVAGLESAKAAQTGAGSTPRSEPPAPAQ